MRTTLALDDDVFAYARSHAQRQRISIGEAVSRLVREGIRAQGLASAAPTKLKSRFSLLPARDEVITTGHVRDLMGQQGM